MKWGLEPSGEIGALDDTSTFRDKEDICVFGTATWSRYEYRRPSKPVGQSAQEHNKLINTYYSRSVSNASPLNEITMIR